MNAKTLNALVMVTLLCCSIGKAQINYSNVFFYQPQSTLIYSNGFDQGAVNITTTKADYESGLLGGATGSNWVDLRGVSDTGQFNANGTETCTQADVIDLPLTPQSNVVYTLQTKVTLSGAPGTWVAAGYEAYATTNAEYPSHYEYNGNGGWNWFLLNFNSSIQYFAGQSTGTTIYSATPAGNVGSGTYTFTFILDGTSNNWVGAAYFTGAAGLVYLGSHTYGPLSAFTPNPIAAVSYGQYATISAPQNITWNQFTLVANQVMIRQQPAPLANVNEGAAFTNSVVIGGCPTNSFQWYSNGVALVNGGNISGATNSSLIINPATPGDATTYFCVVTNLYGAVTSSPSTLGVYANPQIVSANPITYTNLMTLFGGNNTYRGSSPTFSINAGGQVPLSYFWLTNGVAVGGASGTTFTYTNIQIGGPTSFACIVSNSLGTATNTWLAQIVPTPIAPYPQLVLTDAPMAYWRLDETNYDPNQYNNGQVCNDFMSGNNGFYTNTELAQPGYYVVSNSVPITNDPTETSAGFGPADSSTGCDANSMGTNIDFSASPSAEFSVSIWAYGGYSANFYGTSGSEPASAGIVIKGYYGTEEYGLDCGGSGNTVRFFIRNAANTVVSASSTFQLGNNNNWHHLVGVCDESNGVINLYIDGLLTAQATAAAGSGVLAEPNEPITIGASTTPGTLTGDHQFDGALDDCAIFPYALNASQVNALYSAADGVNPLAFTAPYTPTNVVWRGTNTITIPATALGSPPLGYYWYDVNGGTNLTIASGAKGASGTSGVSTLTATLLISNTPSFWSGTELELVVTNSTGMTNEYVTLFNYPPPITIGYTNSILYSNAFNGGTWSLAGTAMTEVNSLEGGTNTTWVDALGTNDPGGLDLEGNGIQNSMLGDSWLVPFTPEPGFVYTMTANFNYYGNPGNWVGIGFAGVVPTNAPNGNARFTDIPAGYDWQILNYSGNVEWFAGPGTTPVAGLVNATLAVASTPANHTMQVILDTTGPQWAIYGSIDGTSFNLTNYYATIPTITGAGFTHNTLTINPADVQWEYWSLTAVSPNGFPPYLLSPTPSTSAITLTNTTVTFTNVTGYGTGPWGYYWVNNANTLTSGATNNTAPNSANLSVASSSLSAGNLELVLTNALGTNITIIPLLSGFPTSQTNLTITVTNNVVYVSWPTAYNAAQLQAQTNPVTAGIGTNWVNFNPNGPGTGTGTNRFVFPLNTTNGTVFFRYRH